MPVSSASSSSSCSPSYRSLPRLSCAHWAKRYRGQISSCPARLRVRVRPVTSPREHFYAVSCPPSTSLPLSSFLVHINRGEYTNLHFRATEEEFFFEDGEGGKFCVGSFCLRLKIAVFSFFNYIPCRFGVLVLFLGLISHASHPQAILLYY